MTKYGCSMGATAISSSLMPAGWLYYLSSFIFSSWKERSLKNQWSSLDMRYQRGKNINLSFPQIVHVRSKQIITSPRLLLFLILWVSLQGLVG